MMYRVGRLLTAVVCGGALLGAPGMLSADPTADITITVTISNLSIGIGDGNIGFGSVSLGDETVSAEKQVVTNDGNVAATYSIQLTAADQLTVGETETAAGADTFVLQALFTGSGGAAPASGDFGADGGAADDVVKSSAPQAASASAFAWTGSTDTGAAVPAADVRDLYFKFSAPTSDSVTGGAQEDLTVTVSATAS